MKANCFFTKISLLFACICLILMSCEDSPEISVSSRNIVFDAFPTEGQTLDISTSVEWTVTIKQDDDKWLTIDPLQGKGGGTITLTAAENPAFDERSALIAISGDGVRTDTVKVTQMAGVNVAEAIKDEAFREYCLMHFDKSPKDGKISLKEVINTIELKIKRLNIYSLDGIEYFSKLRILDCSENLINSIDVGKNQELRILDCSYNPIAHIDVSKNVKLTELIIYSADLENIDVSKNTALTLLAVSNNPIGNIDVSNNKELEGLECNENGLSSLDLKNNTKLLTLRCGSNNLNSLDVSKNTLLLDLWCNNNPFSSIDLSHNTNLQSFSCANGNFESLDLSNNLKLTQLLCNSNRFTTLDISRNTQLVEFKCARNNLTANINISNNKALRDLDFRFNPALVTISVWPGFDRNNSNYFKDNSANYIGY